MALRRIGQILVDMGFISDDQLTMLLEEQDQRPGQLLGKIAQELQLITEEQLVQALSEQLGLKVIELSDIKLTPDLLARITESMAQLYRVIPVKFEHNALTVATCDPQNIMIQDELRSLLGHEVRLVIATEGDIQGNIKKFYSSDEETIDSIIKEVESDKDLKAAVSALTTGGPTELADAEALAESAPVRKLLNMVLLMAIKDHASDIHFEPFEDEFRIRVKADGVLFEMVPPPRHLAFAITTRIKVMANLDIAERRMPQDGRIELTVGGHPVDLRVSVLPTIFGESVVMRVLDRSVVSLNLAKCGLDDRTLKMFRSAMDRPNGIVLVTGPTGSGKTTTLYSALSELNVIEDKIITAEDPVEYDIDGIVQVPIDHDLGVTFAATLRAMLRQDPDIILVGEIRDLETAEIAIQASLTGHLVFSTLHTNDAPATITRLKDMGVPAFMITATVEAILAQRLVRRICANCKEEASGVSKETLQELGLTAEDLKGKKYYRGRGCDVCNNTGYKGRVGLYEMMVMNDKLRDMIMANVPVEDLRKAAVSFGMVTLRDAGLAGVFGGTTTFDEILKETVLDA